MIFNNFQFRLSGIWENIWFYFCVDNIIGSKNTEILKNGPNFLFEYIRIVYLFLVYLQVQTNVALKVTN